MSGEKMLQLYICKYAHMCVGSLAVATGNKSGYMRRLREREIDKLPIFGQTTAVFAAKQG